MTGVCCAKWMTPPGGGGARVSGSPCGLALALTALSPTAEEDHKPARFCHTVPTAERPEAQNRIPHPTVSFPYPVHSAGRSPHEQPHGSDWPHQEPQPEALMSASGNSSTVPGVQALVRRTHRDRGQNPGPRAGVQASAFPPLLVLIQGFWRPRRLGVWDLSCF